MEEIYSRYRPYLFSVAYNILGEIQEAEDLVQDAFMHVLQQGTSNINNIKSYLTRVIANKAIDRLHILKKQREQYPGTWLPEPLITEPESLPQEGILQYEVLHALQQLNPVERAVFVLRSAFTYPYKELSLMCNTTETNCRQLVRRARQKISVQVKTTPPPAADQKPFQQFIDIFLQSCVAGDPKKLADYLKKDIALYSDGGGKAQAAVNVLWGKEVVSKFLTGITKKKLQHPLSLQYVQVNGRPAVVLFLNGLIDSVVYLNNDDKLLSQIFIIRNPDKIIFK